MKADDPPVVSRSQGWRKGHPSRPELAKMVPGSILDSLLTHSSPCHSGCFSGSKDSAVGLGQLGVGMRALLPEEVFSESPSLWSFQR